MSDQNYPEENQSPAPQIVPQSRDAEESLIGSVMINPEAYYDVAQFLQPDDFYVQRNRWIWEAFTRLHERRVPIDFLTVTEDLNQQGQLGEIGGPAYLTALINNVPTSLHAEAYGHLVEEASVRRRMLAAANQIAKLAYKEDDTVENVMDEAEKAIFGVSERRMTRDLQFISQVLSDYYDRIDQLARRGEDTFGVPTGFVDLDRLLGGLQPSDFLLIAGRPGTGKCVTADTRICDPETGELFTIEELVRNRSACLLTLSAQYQLVSGKASDFVNDGLKPVYLVRTVLGREVKVTSSHPFLTIDGWKPLADLTIGEHIAVPRVLPVFGHDDLPANKVKILAYLLADGNMTGPSARFTNDDPRIQEDFINSAMRFPGVRTRLEDSNGKRTPSIYVISDLDYVRSGRKDFSQRLSQAMQHSKLSRNDLAAVLSKSPSLISQWRAGRCSPSLETYISLCEILGKTEEQLIPDGLVSISWKSPTSLRLWLQEEGAWGKTAAEKEMPACVYRLPRSKLSLFLNRMFACDGSVWIKNNGQVFVSYSTVSKKLAHSMQHLLLRFGIIAKLRYHPVKYKQSYRDAYELLITNKSDILLFMDQIGAFGKEQAIEDARKQLEDKVSNPNRDLIPIKIWKTIERCKENRTWASIYQELGYPRHTNFHPGHRAPSRQRLLAIGQTLDSDHLVALAQSDVYWDQITSIECLGERQVYDLTVPETHNFVADDVIVHNTAFMLSAAKNAAQVHKKHVAIFSLEMSNEQLVQRLLSQETGIDSHRMRTGKLNEEEWPLFTQAIEVLSDTHIYLDDTPGLTPLQLRTKCRRLSMEYQLDLVIVDYLQLMSGGMRIDNRVQEVSYISRNMKMLARELNVPVLAAAQLSRAIEQRTDKEPQLSDLRESGCLTGDTLISLASGELAPIASLVDTQPEVVAFDDLKITTARTGRVWMTGHRPVFKLKLKSGRTIRATGNHPFKKIYDWLPLERLKPGDRIAIPRIYPQPSECTNWSEDKLILLAHLIGDGCFVKHQPLHYTSASPENLTAVTDAAHSAFGIHARSVRQLNWQHLYLSAGANKWHPNPIRLWLRELGIDGQHSYEKIIPPEVFTLKAEQLAFFLRHLWSTDGSIYLRRTAHGKAGTIYYSTSCERLAFQIQHLLARLGIYSRVSEVKKNGYRPNYHLHVSGKSEQLKFADLIGAFGDRKIGLEKVVEYLTQIKENTNVDTIPVEVWGSVKDRMRELGISQRKMASMRGTVYGGDAHFGFSPSRTVLCEYSSLLNDAGLQVVAESDVFWDTIVSIEPDGEADVYDMSVPGVHNFVANGIAVHNSLEQDADIVMFIHRPELFEKDTLKQNIAQIKIAKHRNGPVGTIELVFRSNLAKFENAATRNVDLSKVV